MLRCDMRPSLSNPCPTYPLVEGLFGLAVAFVLLGALAVACGSPSVLQCRVDAVAGLPLEPDLITLGDLRTVAAKVKACQASGDAGR